MLHATLSKLPRPLDLDSLIALTIDLSKRHPPERLPGRIWSRISNSSVLKTTRDDHTLSHQTLADGERYFEKEASGIRRRDALLKRQKQLQHLARRYRRPALYTSSAVAVALLALLFRGYQVPISTSIPTGLMLGLQHRLAELWQRFAI